ncbi:MAG: dihydroorotase [Chitinophagales bacterium]|nr:dihydroorotase [Chitinophagales bacterium]
MKYRASNVIVVDPTSSFNGKKTDIIIENGSIITIEDAGTTEGDFYEIPVNGQYVLPGLCDLYADFCDPGFEFREDIHSGADAALRGGYTTVCVIPHTEPVIQNKSQVEYVLNQSKQVLVEILPYGTITANLDGKEPTEMYDMHQSGAIGFTDAPYSIKDAGVMLRALQYCKPFNGTIFTLPFDKTLVGEGQINEGKISLENGMKGISNLSETLQIQRDLEICKYTASRLHFFGISTAESVGLIRKAKQEGMQVTASVFLHHLVFTENEAADFDTNFKTMPPLRTEKDKNALIEGLREGTLDAICTQHTPLDTESKQLEFEYAEFGVIGLETAFQAAYTYLGETLGMEKLVQLMSFQPREIINKPLSGIQKEGVANLFFFNHEETSIIETGNIHSKSVNTPFLGKTLQGKITGIFCKNEWLMF